MSQLFIDRSRYYLGEEYITKIRKCVEALPDDALWRRANEDSNSIANLLLHLTGNIRQWIVEGIGGKPVQRDRASEFSAKKGATGKQLLQHLTDAVREVDAVLAALKPEELAESRLIQGRETDVLSAIYHVVEHFAMHTGQVVLMTKMYLPGAINFYEDAGGLAKPKWGGSERLKG